MISPRALGCRKVVSLSKRFTVSFTALKTLYTFYDYVRYDQSIAQFLNAIAFMTLNVPG